MDRGRRRLIATGMAGVVLVGLRSARAEEWFPTLGEIHHDPDAPVLGNPDGNVTVVEFFDYQCPFCRAGYEPLLQMVNDDGNTRLVLKDWPILGAPSVRASQLSLGCATLGRYAEANAALIEIQGRLDERKIDAALEAIEIQPREAWNAYRSERSKWDSLMQRNAAQADVFNLPGTPAYIIGEDVYPGVIRNLTIRDAIRRARVTG